MTRTVVGAAVATLMAIAGVIAVLLWRTYTHLDAQISWFGWAAMAAGTLVSFGLATGLMGLVFFSARRGFDDRPPLDTPPDS